MRIEKRLDILEQTIENQVRRTFDVMGFTRSMCEMMIQAYELNGPQTEYDLMEYERSKEILKQFKAGTFPSCDPVRLPDNPDEYARQSIQAMREACERQDLERGRS